MNIKNELTRIENAKSNLKEWISENDITVPDNTKIDGLVTLLSNTKISDNNAKISTGSFTLANAQNNYLVTHNLGIIPNFGVIWYSGVERTRTNNTDVHMYDFVFFNNEYKARYIGGDNKTKVELTSFDDLLYWGGKNANSTIYDFAPVPVLFPDYAYHWILGVI